MDINLQIESVWETSDHVPNSVKRLLTKTIKRPEMKAAIQQYVKFRKAGMNHGEANHKAAGIYGLYDDKVFSDIIHAYQKAGKFDLMPESKAKSFSSFVAEEGEPTNTSEKVAPDRDHKVDKKKKKKDDDKDDDGDDKEKKDKKDNPFKKKGKKDMKENTYKGLFDKMDSLDEARSKLPKMLAPVKRKASTAINRIAKQTYFSSVSAPIDAADSALQKLGYKLVDVDGSDYGAIYAGEEGRTVIDIGDNSGNIMSNVALAVQWYKMPSGKWEITMYLS